MNGFTKTNYHTHSTFCDGKNSIQEMAESAQEKGFSILGFSSHSMHPFAASTWHMPLNRHQEYCAQVRETAREYSGKMQILLGFEAEYIRGICCPSFESFEQFSPDYLIGSVHYVMAGDGHFAADGNGAQTRKDIDRYLKGNTKEAVCAYFEQEREMLQKGDFTFLGHCDLIRIQNSPRFGAPIFSEDESWYREQIRLTADAIAASGVCVEINTGAIARGYLNSPYPSQEFLDILHQKNVPVTINSDSHARDTLDFAFDTALSCAKKAGYTELAYYTAGSFSFQKI